MKKGSLSLSVNAIVILVLAIAMLGLGLAFTKTMFKKFGEKLTVPPPDIPATPEEPIVLPAEEIEIKHGQEATFAVNYYNDHNKAIVTPDVICYQNFDGIVGTYTSDYATVPEHAVIAAPQRVDSGTYKSFKVIIPKAATTADNAGFQDVCEIRFCHDLDKATGECVFENTRQIIIKVK